MQRCLLHKRDVTNGAPCGIVVNTMGLWEEDLVRQEVYRRLYKSTTVLGRL